MSDRTWLDKAEAALEGFLSEMVREGRFDKLGRKGMLTHATVVVEYMGEDGDDWYSIVGLPGDKARDLIYHRWLLDRFMADMEALDE